MVNDMQIDTTEDANLAILEGMRPSDGIFAGGLQGDKYKHLQYWRKCSGCQIHTQELGWITLGPAMGPLTATEYFEFQRGKHATPLEKYGKFLAGESSKQKYQVVLPEQRFLPLIEQGGFREIPLDQMIAYNWHRNKALVRYVPELAEVKEYYCTYGHPNKFWTSEDLLKQHINIWHQDIAQPQAVGREISKAIDAVRQTNNTGLDLNSPEGIAILVKTIREAMKE